MRKLVHVSALLIPIVAEATSKIAVLAGLGTVTGVYVLEEILRLWGKRLPLITTFTQKMSRPDEGSRFISRPLYLAIGTILALLLFPKSIAYASIAIVAVGDPVAAYVGEKFGRTHVGRKSLEGFTAGLVASFALTSFLVHPIVGFIGSTVAMLFELLGTLDDNLTMPVSAGVSMVLATLLQPSIGI